VTIYGLLSRLDASSFLGFRIWEFSFRSLGTEYGLTFLKDIVLRHPLKTLEGVLKYRSIFREGRDHGDVTLLFEGSEDDLVARLATARSQLLVAVGFCQKPLRPECPAGRANHDCAFLDQLDLEHADGLVHPACLQCEIKRLGCGALLAGASMYIMTSALDVARDVMIPSVDLGRFRSVLMCLCPYSVRAIALPLTICGIEGFVIGYASGNCVDYEQWSLADAGIKKERTTLSPSAHRRILAMLRDLSGRRTKERSRYVRFVHEGNIYMPVSP